MYILKYYIIMRSLSKHQTENNCNGLIITPQQCIYQSIKGELIWLSEVPRAKIVLSLGALGVPPEILLYIYLFILCVSHVVSYISEW